MARPAVQTKAVSKKNGAVKKNGVHAVPSAGRMTDANLLSAYQSMLKIRTLDERMMTLQRQGRIGFYGTCSGQEAATIGSSMALEPTDWIFPALREAGVMLMRGYGLVPYLSQVFGNSGDPAKGRQMPSHQSSRSVNQVSWSSCIGSQITQATGAAMAAKYKKDGAVVMAYMGDGATSSVDFHTGLNFAGVFKAPVVFVCQNNHWSISIPTKGQTASESIAIKAQAYGFPGVKIDGNDVEAVYAAVSEAVARARRGGGPTLVECETYRMGAHSSSDDPTRYRDQKEVDAWAKRDPIERTYKALLARKAWSPEKDKSLREKLLEEINAAIKESEALPNPAVESLFEDVYAQPTWNLLEQKAELEAVLRAKQKG
jgi:pyruvate dehydrogenase E1 component alpha subunit